MTINPFTIVNAQRTAEAAKDQQLENTPRVAYETLTYDTSSVGQIVIPGALRFQTVFLEAPAVVTGSVMTKGPGSGWAFPLVTAGVYRWLTNSQGYFTGAYVYFNVQVTPAHSDDDVSPRMTVEEASNLQDYWSAEQAAAADALAKARIRYQIQIAQRELRRAQRAAGRGTPQPKITHHLLFQGMAMKDLPDSVISDLSSLL